MNQPHGSTANGMYPVPRASNPSFFQNMKSAISPSQNTGAETPKSAKPIANRSEAEPRRSAEITPIVTPMMTQMIAAPSASAIVRGMRSLISWSTDVRLSYETPSPGQPHPLTPAGHPGGSLSTNPSMRSLLQARLRSTGHSSPSPNARCRR